METIFSWCSKQHQKITLLGIPILITLLVAYTSASAQSKWGLEVRGGANFPVNKLGGAKLNTGFGLEGTVAYRFMPHLAVYTGWSWNKFSANQSFAGSKVDFEETGYCAGLQFIHPFQHSKVSYMLKGGGTYNHIETENNEGKIIDDTGHGFGWQLGAGVGIPLGKKLQLIPEVRYRSLSRDISIGDGSRPVDLNYISAGAGLFFSF